MSLNEKVSAYLLPGLLLGATLSALVCVFYTTRNEGQKFREADSAKVILHSSEKDLEFDLPSGVTG